MQILLNSMIYKRLYEYLHQILWVLISAVNFLPFCCILNILLKKNKQISMYILKRIQILSYILISIAIKATSVPHLLTSFNSVTKCISTLLYLVNLEYLTSILPLLCHKVRNLCLNVFIVFSKSLQ